MPLQEGTCDSCGDPTDVLFSVAILDELPTGGMGMVKKWYCIECKDELEQEAEENKKEKEDEEEDEDKGCPTYDALSKIPLEEILKRNAGKLIW